MTDRELLRDYAEHGSESAFQSLVQRHVDLVFATAIRRLGDAAAAQEVTQDVFVTLARKAAWLRRETTLVGWLHKTTLFAAASGGGAKRAVNAANKRPSNLARP